MTWTWGNKWRLNLQFTNLKCQVENGKVAEVKLGASISTYSKGMKSESKTHKGYYFHTISTSCSRPILLNTAILQPFFGSGSERKKIYLTL